MGYLHGDLCLQNMGYFIENGNLEVYILDLDTMTDFHSDPIPEWFRHWKGNYFELSSDFTIEDCKESDMDSWCSDWLAE